MRLLLSAIALVLAASGCDTDALADRTYPEAGDFPEVNVPALYTADVGRYNARAYVASISACADFGCDQVDAIVLAEHLGPDPVQLGVTLYPEAVRQFREGDRYLLSVEVVEPAGDEPPRITLLGYDRL